MININNLPCFSFPAGEINPSLDRDEDGTVLCRIQNSDDVMKLLFISSLLKNKDTLILPYIPYGRQDRVCNRGEAFTLKVFCNLINGLGFKRVLTLDPHSDVTAALIDNVQVVGLEDIVSQTVVANFTRLDAYTLVSPDAGATKKVEKLAKILGQDSIIYGSKQRDLSTGKLSGFGYQGDVEGKDLLIVDDICDGGGTFVGLAAKLKEGGAKRVVLFVTHNIFSKGLNLEHIDLIITTDSFREINTMGDPTKFIGYPITKLLRGVI